MKNKLLNLEILTYLIFGVLTTVVNIVVYFFFREVFGVHYAISNSIAWILSVLFAFVTNKKWVFKSQTNSLYEWSKEAFLFVAFRALSYVFDMGAMFVMLSVLHSSDLAAKIVSQIFVIVANYVFSKWFVFKSKNV